MKVKYLKSKLLSVLVGLGILYTTLEHDVRWAFHVGYNPQLTEAFGGVGPGLVRTLEYIPGRVIFPNLGWIILAIVVAFVVYKVGSIAEEKGYF